MIDTLQLTKYILLKKNYVGLFIIVLDEKYVFRLVVSHYLILVSSNVCKATFKIRESALKNPPSILFAFH